MIVCIMFTVTILMYHNSFDNYILHYSTGKMEIDVIRFRVDGKRRDCRGMGGEEVRICLCFSHMDFSESLSFTC